MLWVTQVLGQTIRFVDDDAEAGGDGETWGSAFNDLQVALSSVTDLGEPTDLWIAAGNYTPALNDGDRNATFQLRNETRLYGGFAGHETDIAQRDFSANRTILSGDLNGDDEPSFNNIADNSFHVVTSIGTDASAVLDGFTLTGGNADGVTTPLYLGGGLYNSAGSPTLANCTFESNRADSYGGAIYNTLGNPLISNCVFLGNETFTGGAAVCNIAASGAVLTDCVFDGNDAVDYFGGALYNWLSNPLVVQCTFLNNTAATGGAVFSTYSSPTFINTSFYSNVAWTNGGAAYFSEGTPSVTNCIFSGNLATFGGAVQHSGSGGTVTVTNCTFSANVGVSYGGAIRNNVNLTVNNSVFWGNEDANGSGESAQISEGGGNTVVNYSCIEGYDLLGGLGNTGADPLFIDPWGVDRIPGTPDDDLRLSLGSAAIDAADNESLPSDSGDVDGDGDTEEPVPFDADGGLRLIDEPLTPDSGRGTAPVVDMGACETQISAKLCEGDANGDGNVDPLDVGFIRNRFSCPVGTGDPECDAADQNGDGVIDPLDDGYIVARFGDCPG